MDSIGITDSTTQFVINGILTLWSLIVSLCCASVVDKVGRRPMFLAATGGKSIIRAVISRSQTNTFRYADLLRPLDHLFRLVRD